MAVGTLLSVFVPNMKGYSNNLTSDDLSFFEFNFNSEFSDLLNLLVFQHLLVSR